MKNKKSFFREFVESTLQETPRDHDVHRALGDVAEWACAYQISRLADAAYAIVDALRDIERLEQASHSKGEDGLYKRTSVINVGRLR
jgi:hypothetical protein